MHPETRVAERRDIAPPGYDDVLAAAERHARAIVQEAEEEAIRILEEAASVAFRAKARRPRPRRWAFGTLLLACSAVSAAAALVVGIAIGQM
jgi:cell division septum initiation protein DivIVA